MSATMKSQPSGNTPGLVRAMTRRDLTALAVNGIIGAGIFGLPATAARLLGYASPLGFILCAAVVFVFVLCFAEVASHFTETGGPYLYGRTIFGSFVGFEVGWTVWLARVSAFATNSNILVAYLSFFIPQVGAGAGRAAVLIAVPAMLALINARGVAGGARFGVVFAAAKLAALILFAAVGLAYVDWGRVSNMAVPPNANWGVAILGLIYTFTGFEYAVIPAAEAKDPRRDLGWSLVAALSVCAVIYLAVQLVALGTLQMNELTASASGLADAGRSFLGPLAGGLISLLACISVIGNLSALVLVSPRLTLAFSERGDFPAIFARLHASYGTPVVSIVFFAAVGSILAIYGTFEWLVLLSVLARLANYIVTCAAAPILRKRLAEPPKFKLPLGAVIPVIGIALCVWLFLQAPNSSKMAFLYACIAGAALYVVRGRRARPTA
jgi:basic amino acid/polyamine antiporter, APA family